VWHETVLVKQGRHTLIVWLSIYAVFTVTDAADAGPFRDFFKTLRSAITQPKEAPRPHRSTHKRKKTAPNDVPKSEISDKETPAASGQPEVRWAKAGSVASDQKAELQYGTPVPGKPGLVTSPFAPDAGYVQVLGFPPGSPVEDPYTGKIFLTP
jgi:hypothetical protein